MNYHYILKRATMPVPDAEATPTHQVEPELPSRGKPKFESTEDGGALPLEPNEDAYNEVTFLDPMERRRLNGRPSGRRLMERLLREERRAAMCDY